MDQCNSLQLGVMFVVVLSFTIALTLAIILAYSLNCQVFFCVNLSAGFCTCVHKYLRACIPACMPMGLRAWQAYSSNIWAHKRLCMHERVRACVRNGN